MSFQLLRVVKLRIINNKFIKNEPIVAKEISCFWILFLNFIIDPIKSDENIANRMNGNTTQYVMWDWWDDEIDFSSLFI